MDKSFKGADNTNQSNKAGHNNNNRQTKHKLTFKSVSCVKQKPSSSNVPN